MPYIIQTSDHPDRAHLRAEKRDEHLAYLEAHKEILLAGGAVLDDDGAVAYGSVLIIDTDDREEAERFAADDPFTKAGLFEAVTVTRWRKVFFNYERLM